MYASLILIISLCVIFDGRYIYDTLCADICLGKTSIPCADFPSAVIDSMADTKDHKSEMENQLINLNVMYPLDEETDCMLTSQGNHHIQMYPAVYEIYHTTIWRYFSSVNFNAL